MTIPGVGPYLALVIYSEIGTIKRFESAKKLVMYSGLCPGIYQTGSTEYQVRNSACNKFLKFAFTITSGRATLIAGSRFEKKYSKVKNKKGYPTTRRVIARELATIVLHMLSKEESFKN
ncbi:MAG: transposase [Candidatus Woesearchaeota archaeon]|jgi:transposase|nr:transposase [Candidatus Woesearchaeota archaeon]